MSRSSPWQCHLVNMLNHDLKTSVDVYASLSWWILGYQDRAARLSDKAVAHARRRGHPFDLGWVLYTGAEAFEYRCEPEKVRLRAEECERLGRDNSMPVLWAMGAPLRHGLALIREGRAAEGIPPLKAGMAFWDSLGGECRSPHRNSVLAEGMALTCDLDNALRLIDEQIAQVERPAGKNAFTYAEILRLKGWMLSLKGDLEGAERNYLASLDRARGQQAKFWERRTSTSLARLWPGQSRRKEAHELLAPIYNWFTEGFDTMYRKDAKALLDQLVA